MISAHQNFIEALMTDYPQLDRAQVELLVSEQLICPFTVHLPRKVLNQARALVRNLFEIRKSSEYVQHYSPYIQEFGLAVPSNYGFAMSYDVHWEPTQEKIKLIEINTNASFLFLAEQLYKSQHKSIPVDDFHFSQLIETLKTEHNLAKKDNSSQLDRIAIIDEQPQKQRLYIEFLVAQQHFEKNGIGCTIEDFATYRPGTADLVYNRFNDFMFRDKRSQHLLESFNSGTDIFTPHPVEYFLLADKQRMVDWQTPDFLNSSTIFPARWAQVKDFVPVTESFRPDERERFWAERRKFFFKPKNSFGSKQAYKGASISRKIFDGFNEDFIRQEYVQAPELTFETPIGPQAFRYDLRIFAYQDQVQMIIARVFQGQLTNLKTPYGGFATVVWE